MSGVKTVVGAATLVLVTIVTLIVFRGGPFPESAGAGISHLQVRADLANEEFERIVRHLCLEEFEAWGVAVRAGQAPKSWDAPAGCRGMDGVPDGAVLGPPSRTQEEIEAMLERPGWGAELGSVTPE